MALLGGLLGAGLAAATIESLRALFPADLQRAGTIRSPPGPRPENAVGGPAARQAVIKNLLLQPLS